MSTIITIEEDKYFTQTVVEFKNPPVDLPLFGQIGTLMSYQDSNEVILIGTDDNEIIFLA